MDSTLIHHYTIEFLIINFKLVSLKNILTRLCVFSMIAPNHHVKQLRLEINHLRPYKAQNTKNIYFIPPFSLVLEDMRPWSWQKIFLLCNCY